MDHLKSRRKLLIWSALFFILIIAGTAYLAIQRRQGMSRSAEHRSHTEKEGRGVEVTEVKPSPNERKLLLTGEVRPYFSVTLYPRVSGYLTKLNVDIGDSVKKGQSLAHIESPEQEEAFISAEADAFNKKRIAARMRQLLARKLISQQQADQAFSDANISEANLRTQTVVRGYQEIIAPFDGVISNRYVDPGALLQNSSGSQSASQPLFLLTQADPLRVFIYVDQRDAPYVKVGTPVEVSLPSQNGQRYSSKISMIAAELDPRTRTLLAEFILENPEHKIVAGSFVQVHMTVQNPQLMEVPIQALVIRDKVPFVPIVDAESKLKYARIELVENNGENILIRSGVKVGDRVALNVGNTIVEGQKVRVAAPEHQAAGTQGAAEKKGGGT